MFRARAARSPAGSLPALALALVVVATVALSSSSARAQFRNNGVQIPNAGWLSLGTSSDWLNGQFGQNNRWNATDQVTIGAGYFRAVGYNLWLDNQVSLGLGGETFSTSVAPRTVVSLAVSIGMRYNFLDEKHRPFVSGHIQYLQFFNVAGTTVAGNEVLGGYPMWVGVRPSVGYEWFFLEEMAVQGEIGPIVMGGLDAFAPKFSAMARLSFNVYF